MDKSSSFARFKQSVEYLKDMGQIHRQKDIAVAVGVSESYMSDVLKDRGGKFSDYFLERFARAYSDYINEEWLLTGEGEMEVPDKSLKPYVEDISAQAGEMWNNVIETSTSLKNANSFTKPFDFIIKGSGNSMSPFIEDGDILFCRYHTDNINMPIGKICVVMTKDSVVVKELKSIKNGIATLHSINPDYPDYSVKLTEIFRLAVVVNMSRDL